MKNKGHRPARKRDWHHTHEDAFTHDLKKHRKAQAPNAKKLPPPVPPEEVVPNALAIGHVGHYAFVKADGAEHLALIDPALGERTATVVAPGDEVMIEDIDGQFVVRGVAPRRTKLSRPAHVYSDVVEQVIAANVDLLVIVAAAAQPRLKAGLVDRYLISAEVGGVTPVLIVNKMDLVDREPEKVAHYREIGMPVLNTSCQTGQGIAELRRLLAGNLAVLAGQSGVGKSSLLNALDPALEIDTQEVSAFNEKGRHTTSASRLYELHDGIRIIDTPGIRSLALWNVTPEEVSFFFPEIAEAAADCKFRNCTHTHEPDCAVRAAVEAGKIPRLRYGSYTRIREDLKDKTNW